VPITFRTNRIAGHTDFLAHASCGAEPAAVGVPAFSLCRWLTIGTVAGGFERASGDRGITVRRPPTCTALTTTGARHLLDPLAPQLATSRAGSMPLARARQHQDVARIAFTAAPVPICSGTAHRHRDLLSSMLPSNRLLTAGAAMRTPTEERRSDA
jgi:hypothetical protein